MSKFNTDTNAWFENLIQFGKTPSPLKDQIIALAKVDIPNRRRLEKMIELIEQLPAKFLPMLYQAKAILNRKYSKRGKDNEFKLTYNNISKWRGQCSATSEFFSMIDQAITYEDDLVKS